MCAWVYVCGCERAGGVISRKCDSQVCTQLSGQPQSGNKDNDQNEKGPLGEERCRRVELSGQITNPSCVHPALNDVVKEGATDSLANSRPVRLAAEI